MATKEEEKKRKVHVVSVVRHGDKLIFRRNSR